MYSGVLMKTLSYNACVINRDNNGATTKHSNGLVRTVCNMFVCKTG